MVANELGWANGIALRASRATDAPLLQNSSADGSDAWGSCAVVRRCDCGLQIDTLEATGRGKTDPVASNSTADVRASNRRVEIVLQR
ncbi:hypothetical protein [Burkholderia sp. Ac-20353]|uniref:hypothetical protein n=1 Tax=Burkholderia sp. Ac-20353 TaxID=2703894 RepID=UPI001F120FD2|nr:hypothetical protein [Burkholderia sp. Ac-20353]